MLSCGSTVGSGAAPNAAWKANMAGKFRCRITSSGPVGAEAKRYPRPNLTVAPAGYSSCGVEYGKSKVFSAISASRRHALDQLPDRPPRWMLSPIMWTTSFWLGGGTCSRSTT